MHKGRVSHPMYVRSEAMLKLARQCMRSMKTRCTEHREACERMSDEWNIVVHDYLQRRYLSGGSSHSPDVLEKGVSLIPIFLPYHFLLVLVLPCFPTHIPTFVSFPVMMSSTSTWCHFSTTLSCYWLMKSKIHGWTGHELKCFSCINYVNTHKCVSYSLYY